MNDKTKTITLAHYNQLITRSIAFDIFCKRLKAYFKRVGPYKTDEEKSFVKLINENEIEQANQNVVTIFPKSGVYGDEPDADKIQHTDRGID